MAGVEEEPQAFDFAQWCKDNGLTRKTEGTLSKEVLTSVDALTMLEERDIRKLGLPIGQRKFLQCAVDTLRGKSANPSLSRDTDNHANATEDPPPDVESSEADPEDTTTETLQQPVYIAYRRDIVILYSHGYVIMMNSFAKLSADIQTMSFRVARAFVRWSFVVVGLCIKNSLAASQVYWFVFF